MRLNLLRSQNASSSWAHAAVWFMKGTLETSVEAVDVVSPTRLVCGTLNCGIITVAGSMINCFDYHSHASGFGRGCFALRRIF